MSEKIIPSSEYHDEINIREILLALNDGKKLILYLTSIFIVGSIFLSLLLPKIWISDTLVSLTAQESVSRGSSNSGALSSVASLAGISMGSSSGGVDKAQLVLATINSRDFFRHLVSFEGVLPNLLATKGFDEATQTTIFNSKAYDEKNQEWVEGQPNFSDSMKAYKNTISTYYDPMGDGFIKISTKHRSPIFAHDFLTLIVREVNNLLRDKDLREADAALGYLYEQLDGVTQSDVRLSIATLIENQLRTQMFANIRQNYAIDPLDTPYVPELRSSPQRTKIVILGALLGLLISIVLVIGRYYINKNIKK